MERSSVMSGLMEQLKVDHKHFYDSSKATDSFEEYGLLCLLSYYCSNGTINLLDYSRLTKMVQSPDKENIEVVKEILKIKYNLL